MPSGTISNTADLLVGGGPGQKYLAGALDFLRISHGTLTDAKTTIEELYDWQFRFGPQHFDFDGNEIIDNRRDAGAFEGPLSQIAIRSFEDVGRVAQNVVTALKTAAEITMQTGINNEETMIIGDKRYAYADSVEILLNDNAKALSDTFTVPANDTYNFIVISKGPVAVTLEKIDENGSTPISCTNAKEFQVTLMADCEYIYEMRLLDNNHNGTCILKWYMATN